MNDVEIKSTLQEALDLKSLNSEEVVEIIYQQQAVFRVRPVTRCTRYNYNYILSTQKVAGSIPALEQIFFSGVLGVF